MFHTNVFCLFILFTRYKEISLRVLQQKLSASEAFVKQHYYNQGAHSSDETGAMSENNFPRWVELFIEYFEADSSKPLKNDKDRAKRDKRRKTGHEIVGAQVSDVFFYVCDVC